jgi:hypothetical protein
MGLRAWNWGVLVAVGGLWLASGTQREKPVLAAQHSGPIAGLEAELAAAPNDATKVTRLAQAYLDARSPGLALAVVERAPEQVRAQPAVDHVYARALIDQGRAVDALAVERRVLTRCASPDEVSCSAWLVASATRRADILEQLVQLGIEDAQAHPEASAVAYHNATREATLVLR